MQPKVGKLYRHFKGGLYQVIAVGKHSEDQSKMVVYVNMDQEGTWIRPLEMWNEIVDWPEGRRLARFIPFKGVRSGHV